MATFSIKVVRVQGPLPQAEELLTIQCESRENAYRLSQLNSTLVFKGQERKTYIKAEGEAEFTEYRDYRY